MTQPDPVDVWHSMRGSLDFPAVVQAGQALCRALEHLRAAWIKAAQERAVEIAQLDSRIAELEAQLVIDPDPDPSDLEHEVRTWHEAEHADGWAVCPHPICRAAAG